MISVKYIYIIRDIKIISKSEALKIDPNINSEIKCAAFCEMDGYVSANQTGDAYTKALKENNVDIIENFETTVVEHTFRLPFEYV